jgi:hypothetical protein
VPVVLTVGGTIATVVGNEFLDQLIEPNEFGVFLGTLLHVLGLTAALVTGVVTITRRPPRSR